MPSMHAPSYSIDLHKQVCMVAMLDCVRCCQGNVLGTAVSHSAVLLVGRIIPSALAVIHYRSCPCSRLLLLLCGSLS